MNFLASFINTNKAEIFTGFGISAIFLGVVQACRNSMKAVDVIEEHNHMREIIEEDVKKDPELSEKREMGKLYGFTGARLIGLFALPAALIIGGVGSCVYATKLTMDKNVELAEKNAGLAALAAGIESRFEKYRERVTEKYGKEVDEQLMCPTGEVEIEKEEVDENGKVKKKKVKQKVYNPEADLNQFTFYITRSNPLWNDDPDMMDMTRRSIQTQLDVALHSKRLDGRPNWITYNDIRKAWSIDTIKDGLFTGIVDDPTDPECDCYISMEGEMVQVPRYDGILDDAYRVTVHNCRDIYDKIA